MSTLKNVYNQHVTLPEDVKIFLVALLITAMALVLLAYDAFAVVTHTVNINSHLPFVPALGLLAVSQIILLILRRG